MLYIRLPCSGTNKVHREARQRLQIHPYLSSKEMRSLYRKCSKKIQLDHEPFLQTDSGKILWNYRVQTDRRIDHKPNIFVLERNNRTILIIDIAIPNNASISRKK